MSAKRPSRATKPPWTVTDGSEDEGATEGATSEEERGHIQGRGGRSRADAGGSGDGVRDRSRSPRHQRWRTEAEPGDGVPQPPRFNPKRTPGVQPPLNMGHTQSDRASTGRRRCRLRERSTAWKCQDCDVRLCLQPERNCYWQHHQGV